MNQRIARKFDGTLEDLVFGPLRDDSGAVLYPSASTFELTDGEVTITTPGGTFTNDPDTGLTTYDWSASEESAIMSALPRQNVRVRWTFTVGAESFERTQYLDFVAVRLITDIHDADLIRRYSLLAEHRPRLQSRATGGSTTTIVDTDRLRVYEPQFFLASFVGFNTGANKGARARVTLFDAVDGTLTLDSALPYAVEEGDVYEIEYSYEPQIAQAYRVIERYTREWIGDLASLKLLDGLDFSDVHLSLALQYACESLVRENTDEFALAAARFSEEHGRATNELRAKLDGMRERLLDDSGGDAIEISVKPHYVYMGG